MLTNSPEESARDLLESFAHEHAVRDVTAVRVGLHLPELLEMLGLDYTEVDTIVDARGRELLGEWDPEKKIIVVSQASPYMKNFTIAHEIAHARLHPGSVKYRDSSAHLLGPQTDPQERDANRFATALLMPSDGVRNAYFCSFDAIFDLGDLKEEQIYRLRLGHQQRITREQIERSRLREIARLVATSSFTDREPLHREFGVSKATMAIRLEELNLVVTRRLASHHVSRPSSHRLAAVVAEPSHETTPRELPPPPSTLKTVVLVGEHAWHAQNRIFLRRHGWTLVDDDSADAVAKLRNDPPCGAVVHRSFWKHIPLERWQDTFRTLVELSSFIFVRVDLAEARDLVTTAVEELPPALLDERAVGAFRQVEGDQLDDEDLFALKRVFDFKHKAAQVVLRADTSPPDTVLLKMVAAERFVASDHQHIAVTAELLGQGNSGARGYVLSANDGTQPLFVKVGKPRELGSERERTRKFERHLPGIAVPDLRFHGAVGALIQPFISADGTSTRPAASLEQFLQELSPDRARLFLDSILPAILKVFTGLATERTSDKARHLNANVRNYKSYAAEGLTWVGAPIVTSRIDGFAVCALKILMGYNAVAFVHADAHLRNILLRNSTEPVLVDFANAGAGHPLLDFVRVELGIWTVLLKNVKQNVAMSLVTELLARETIGSETKLAFSGCGQAIDVVLRSSALIRDCCRAVARGDASWFQQYRALHVLLALGALRHPKDQYLSFAVFSSFESTLEASTRADQS